MSDETVDFAGMMEWMEGMGRNSMTITTPAVFAEKFGKSTLEFVMRRTFEHDGKVIIYAKKKGLVAAAPRSYALAKGIVE